MRVVIIKAMLCCFVDVYFVYDFQHVQSGSKQYVRHVHLIRKTCSKLGAVVHWSYEINIFMSPNTLASANKDAL